MKRFGLFFLFALLLGAGVFFWAASATPRAETVEYGVTFSKFRAEELGLDWRETYQAVLNDLGVQKLRLVAHWDMVEPEPDQYNFEELDYQVALAEARGAEVILAIGRRLPSWPECHEPYWADDSDLSYQEDHILEYMRQVINRYKDSPSIVMWQVENEPFIVGFAHEQCGALDIDFLDVEIEHVRALDPTRPILMTASGELGLWHGTWERGDVFGSTLYRFMWHPWIGTFVYPTTPEFFRAKATLTKFTTGIHEKPNILAELAAEPWLLKPIKDTELEVQLSRMGLDKLKDTIQFARKTHFEEQYLWGAEWWYYLKVVHDRDEVWEYTKGLF